MAEKDEGSTKWKRKRRLETDLLEKVATKRRHTDSDETPSEIASGDAKLENGEETPSESASDRENVEDCEETASESASRDEDNCEETTSESASRDADDCEETPNENAEDSYNEETPNESKRGNTVDGEESPSENASEHEHGERDQEVDIANNRYSFHTIREPIHIAITIYREGCVAMFDRIRLL